MEKGVWRTINGRRVFIGEGQSVQEAMRKSGKFDNKESDKNESSAKEGKEYREKIKKVFDKYNGVEDGTFDINTGKKIDKRDGYSVSFFQSSDNDDDSTFAKKCNECKDKCDGNVYVGVYGGDPEPSFYTKDRKTAIDIMYKYNQESIWDWEAQDLIINEKYDKSKNKTNKKME